MPKSGLFAGQVTEDAPIHGAVTDKQAGYHWMQWTPVIPTSGEFSPTAGVCATELIYFGSGTYYPHPFEGQEFSEWTYSTVFLSNSVPTFLNNYRTPCGINAPGGVQLKWYSGNIQIAMFIYSQPTGTANLHIGSAVVNLVSAGASWTALHWYCVTLSYSQPLNVAVYSITNMSLGEEVYGTITISNNVPVSYTGATTGQFSSVATYGAKLVSTYDPDALSEPWQGSLGHTLVHNDYVDLSNVGNRRKFCGIDGIINLGSVGQNPFGVQPLLYMPSSGPWDSRGTADTGTYPDDYFLAEPIELNTNLPPIAS